MSKSKVFFNLDFGANKTGKIVFELFDNVVPKTAENFRQLCKHSQGYGFKNSHFHRIINDFMAQGGDFTNHNGTGGKSIYGAKFEDENFKIKHTEPYLLSMANAGKNTNGSQFFITFVPCPWLDGKHVVFGKVVEGKNFVDDLNKLGTESGKPRSKVTIIECGEV